MALVARVVISVDLSVMVGNALICLGVALYGQAIHLMLHTTTGPRWPMQVQPLIWLALLMMVDWPLHRRAAVMSLVYVVLLAPSVWALLRYGWRAERSLRAVVLTMAIAMTALLLRAGHAMAYPEQYTDLLQASLGQGLTILVAFVCLLGAGFGFVLAVFERVAHQMETLASDVFGRTGGEEFGLVLPDTDVAGARWLVDAVRRAVEQLQVVSDAGAPVQVTVSAGVAVADANTTISGDRLYGQADQSLYEAKRAGRNRVEVYGSTAGASAALPLG